jgi:uncharacterized heparinase superfamily protein
MRQNANRGEPARVTSPSEQLRAWQGFGLASSLRQAFLRRRLKFARSWLGRFGQRASRFLFVPPHLHLADPSVATDFLSGQIVLAGRSLLAGGRSVFDVTPPSSAFAAALHGFDWLRHFDASGDPRVREGARQILDQWLSRRENATLPGAEAPESLARRVIAWVTHSALITEKADFSTYRRLITHLTSDAAMLRVLANRRGIGMLRLEAGIASLFYALSLDRPVTSIRQAEAMLAAALEECILPDGGPKNRDAGSAVRIVADLIPLLALYRARQLTAPDDFAPVLLRMIGFIRMMQHPDGGLALFAGAGGVTRDLVAQVTRFGAGRVARLVEAPDSGFERVEDEFGIVIADTGAMPPRAFAGQAGASALAFEFSTKSDRLIVNCGMPPSAEGDSARSYRSGPAHSTVLIDDLALASIEPLAGAFGGDDLGVFAAEAGLVPQRQKEGGRESLLIGHTGLRSTTGYVLERQLILLPEGGGLQGIDRAISVGNSDENRRITLAFHLHPRVLPVPLSRQDAVVLRLPHQAPGRDMWLFESPGIALHLEESRCFEQDIASPKTEAIILDVAISGSTEIHWRLTPYRG